MTSLSNRELDGTHLPERPWRFGGHVWSFGFRICLLSLLSLLPLLFSGCLKEMIFFGYLIGGPPSIEPDFDLNTKKSMTAKDVTVAVVCYAPLEVKYNFSSIDAELAKYVTYRLVEHKIKVVNPDQVRAWLDENKENWDEPSEIGKALNVKYVVYIDLENFDLYEEHSHNLLRGHSEGMVSVFEMDEQGDGEKIYSKEITSRFPTVAPRSTTEIPFMTFKQQYLSRLSQEIGRLFYEHYNGDDIPDAT